MIPQHTTPAITLAHVSNSHSRFYYGCLATIITSILMIAAAVLLFVSFAKACEIPTDGDLIKEFSNNRYVLEQLKAMFEHDERLASVDAPPLFLELMHSVGIGGKSKDSGVDNNANEQFRSLLKKVSHGSAGVGRNWEDGSISITIYTRGLFLHGFNKGYAYCSRPPRRIVQELDHPKQEWVRTHYYKHIEGNWYLFVSFN